MSSFSELKLSSWIQKQLEVVGLARPTPIQTNCIPVILSGQDCIGVAQTGSGKTLAFALPILQTLSEDPYGIFALILTPTRELAFQIADQFRVIGKRINVRDCVVVGGKDMVTQGKELSGSPHIVIATPGRLADHLNSCRTFDLKKIRYLVLDEADRMFDGSFDEQLETIFKALPTKRQTLLFTATFSESLEKLRSQKKPPPFFYEAPSNQVTVDKLDQRFVMTPAEARDGYMVHLVQKFRQSSEKGLVIIFVRTVKECEVLSLTLRELGFPNTCLHSNKTTHERQKSLSRFRSHHVRLLIATDVASRGLDIPAVDYVINHNVPQASKNYVHRVGRTARAGRCGSSVTLVTPHDVKLVRAIEGLIKTELREMEVEDTEVAEILAQVNVVRREQEIRLAEKDFEERKEINRRKKLLSKGIDPDEEDRRLEAVKSKRRKEFQEHKAERRKAFAKEETKGDKGKKLK